MLNRFREVVSIYLGLRDPLIGYGRIQALRSAWCLSLWK